MPDVDDPSVILFAIRAGDPTASDRFAEHYAPPLRATLRVKFPFVPPEELADAANDALLFLIMNPERYQPERGAGILTFLITIATRRVLDILRTAKRRSMRENAVGGAVELELCSANNEKYRELETNTTDDPDALSPEVAQWLEEVLPDPRDRRLLDLIMEGRADVADVATLVGIAHLSPTQQQAEWKRQRDRLLARIRRRREEFRRMLYEDK